MDVSDLSLVAFFLCTPITATPVIQNTEYAVLIGGNDGNFNYDASVEAWFPGETSPCTVPPTIPALPQAVGLLNAAVLGNTIIYCGGMNISDVYNQCYNYTVGSSRVFWDPAPSMIYGRYYFTLTSFQNLLIATGGNFIATGEGFIHKLSSVEVYQDGRWSEVVDWELTIARYGHCAVKYGDSKLVLTGGYPIRHIVKQLDLTTGEWTHLPSMKYGREEHSCVSFRDDIIVAGGTGSGDMDSAERFSSATGNWEVLPRLNTGRMGHSMGVLNGYPTVMGGIGLDSTEYWNGTQWVYGKPLQNSRSRHGAVVLTCE